MAIESDRAQALSGIRHGVTTGSPIALHDSESRLGELAANDGRRGRADRPRRQAWTVPSSPVRGPATRTSPASPSTGTRTCAICSSAPARARPPLASPSASIARQLLQHFGTEIVSHVASLGDAVDPRCARRHLRGRPRDSRRFTVALCRPRRRSAHDRRHRRGARGWRHAGRQLRGDRARRAGRPGQPRPVGSQARWAPGPGADVDPGDQGRRHRTRLRSGGAARLADSRRNSSADSGTPSSQLPVERPTNNAGGLEGGITNGQDLRVTAT